MMKVTSDVTIVMDRKTAAWLMTLVGGLCTNCGAGARLAPLFDLLEGHDLTPPEVAFRIDNQGGVVMYTTGQHDDTD